MKPLNAWANPSSAGATEAVQMAAFLEERSQAPDVRELNQKFCEIVAAKPGERLLEVGSGSGLLCRMLAPHLQPGGHIVGVDISPEMAGASRKYALADGITAGISFDTGAAQALPFSAGSFDGAIAARLLLHLADPDFVLREMKRVVKPGGRVVLMDWDFETVTVDHPHQEITRRLLQWRCNNHGGNNWSGRQLWRRMQTAGFYEISVHPWVTVTHSEGDGLTQSLYRAAQVACDGGAISPVEKEAWLMELKHRISTETFFASIVYFIVSGILIPDRE